VFDVFGGVVHALDFSEDSVLQRKDMSIRKTTRLAGSHHLLYLVGMGNLYGVPDFRGERRI
jgi:hypothetical protein